MIEKIARLMKYDDDHPEGQGTSPEEKWYLFSLLRMIKPETVIEIGVSRGHMTAWLALALKINGKGKLVSVDNWSRRHGGEAKSSSHALKRLGDNGLDRVVTFVGSDSTEFLKTQADRSIDMVWVDGDHSFEGARDDIVEALRVARRVVGVHDTNQRYAGPRDAIVDIFDEKAPGFWVKGSRGIWLCNVEATT